MPAVARVHSKAYVDSGCDPDTGTVRRCTLDTRHTRLLKPSMCLLTQESMKAIEARKHLLLNLLEASKHLVVDLYRSEHVLLNLH